MTIFWSSVKKLWGGRGFEPFSRSPISESQTKPEIEMSAWSFRNVVIRGRKVVILRGYIKNHPVLGDVGDIFKTSAIIYFDGRKMTAETMNTIYKLV